MRGGTNKGLYSANKCMQTDLTSRCVPCEAADAGRYVLFQKIFSPQKIRGDIKCRKVLSL